jgi:hypothetical protein
MNDRYLIIKEKYYIFIIVHTSHKFPVTVKDSQFIYICNYISKHEYYIDGTRSLILVMGQ